MGIENYNQKDGNKYGGQTQLVSSTDGIIPPIFKSLVQFLEFDAGAYLLLRRPLKNVQFRSLRLSGQHQVEDPAL